ncbi:hypothetical protein BAAM1489_05760 [Bifidobacterium animalis subsp. animalis MCC 1489]|nr:hypothetical protein BAAM1489_05760 [Bifidobacterium animalis subsp. animalis MCC 1489]
MIVSAAELLQSAVIKSLLIIEHELFAIFVRQRNQCHFMHIASPYRISLFTGRSA